MRKTLALGIALFCGFIAKAQENPAYQVYAGYDYARFNPSSNGYVPSLNANGGGGQFIFNLKQFNWLSGVGDITVLHKGTLNGNNYDTTVTTFTGGPRFSWHNSTRFVPFGEVLLGGYYAATSTRVALSSDTTLPPGINAHEVSSRISASKTGFGMYVGGGLDIKMNKYISLRPVEADYFLGRIPDPWGANPNQQQNTNNFRYSGGVVFNLGGSR